MTTKRTRTPRRQAPPEWKWTPARIGAAALALALVLGLGATALVATFTRRGGGEVRTPQVTGDALPVIPEAGTPDTAIGSSAPEIRGTDHSGVNVSMTADGRHKLVVVMSHWCADCRRVLPLLRDWVLGGDAPEEVDVYLLSAAVEPQRANYPPRAWLDRERWQGPVIADEAGTAAQALGVTSYPSWLVLDPDGRVLARTTGVLRVSEIEAILSRVLQA